MRRACWSVPRCSARRRSTRSASRQRIRPEALDPQHLEAVVGSLPFHVELVETHAIAFAIPAVPPRRLAPPGGPRVLRQHGDDQGFQARVFGPEGVEIAPRLLRESDGMTQRLLLGIAGPRLRNAV